MSTVFDRARQYKRSPLQQIAYEAFREQVLTSPTDPKSPQLEVAFRKAWADYEAVKDGRAEPLPQYQARTA